MNDLKEFNSEEKDYLEEHAARIIDAKVIYSDIVMQEKQCKKNSEIPFEYSSFYHINDQRFSLFFTNQFYRLNPEYCYEPTSYKRLYENFFIKYKVSGKIVNLSNVDLLACNVNYYLSVNYIPSNCDFCFLNGYKGLETSLKKEEMYDIFQF